MSHPQRADYIVIGGGSAGCILAARLAAAGRQVVLLEAGDAAEAHPETLSSDGFKYAFANDATMWHRMSAKLPGMGRKYLGTGRGMGGSGSVNGMVYTRGDRRDFANWPAGWQYEDCVPAFEGVEAQLRPRPRPATPFVKRFIDACVAVGMRHEDGMNQGDLAGVVGANDMNYQGASRRSSYRAFIKEPMEHDGPVRQHLHLILRAQVTRVEFVGNKAVAVHYIKNNCSGKITVGKEVLFAAGALETPRLLLLSGVGPAAHLQQVGVPVVHDSAGVGQHLHDHPNACIFFRGKVPPDFAYPQVYAFDTADGHKAAPEMCWVAYSAPASIQHAMHRMLPVLALPGKLHAIKALRTILRKLIDVAFTLPPLQKFVANIFGIVVILGKPTSRGSVQLASSNPQDAAIINPAWYATAHDKKLMEDGIARVWQIMQQPSMASVQAKALSPAGKSDISKDKLWQWIHKATMTTYHFCGSVRMGTDDASPVAPDSLRVKGLANVRVADASVMPEIPVSALNAPSMMIGWRCAEIVLKEEIKNDEN